MLVLLKAVRWFDRKHSAAIAKQKVAAALLKQQRSKQVGGKKGKAP